MYLLLSIGSLLLALFFPSLSQDAFFEPDGPSKAISIVYDREKERESIIGVVMLCLLNDSSLLIRDWLYVASAAGWQLSWIKPALNYTGLKL